MGTEGEAALVTHKVLIAYLDQLAIPDYLVLFLEDDPVLSSWRYWLWRRFSVKMLMGATSRRFLELLEAFEAEG